MPNNRNNKTKEVKMTITLAELLKDSAYKLTQFKPAQIKALHKRKKTARQQPNRLVLLVRPDRFERPTPRFEVRV
jgi:hypothetical protein